MSRKKSRKPGLESYPIVTIAHYGPDDKTVTKIVATLILGPKQEQGEMKRWLATDVTSSPAVPKELLDFIVSNRARGIVLTTGVLGCIHEEGKDYPLGEACPYCPFWRGRDRWATAKPICMTLGAFRNMDRWPR